MEYADVAAQLAWKPEVVGGPVPKRSRVVVGGMGGSALPGEALQVLDPSLDIEVHRGYDLPDHPPADALYVAVSYSGNTEEALSFEHQEELSFAKNASGRSRPLAIITSGGALLTHAKDEGLPYVQVPGDVQPRNALIYLVRALAALAGRDDLLAALGAAVFDEAPALASADALAGAVGGAMPIFYASRRNAFFSYLYKINFNETGKMPAFANTFPELNHNEMQAFDTGAPESAALAHFVLLRDLADDPRIAKRMDVFAALMRERGRGVTEIVLEGDTRASQLARGWFVAHRAARALALARGVDPESVPLVEEFKKRLHS